MFSRIPKIRSLSILAAASLFAFAFAPGLHASAMNEKTLVTVNAPVEIPGQVLPAGTYAFEVMSNTGGQLVAIRNHKTGRFIKFVLASPTYRAVTPTKAIVRLAERPSNNPPAISKWFYPGLNSGLRFTYPNHPLHPGLAQVPTKLKTSNG